MPAVSPKRTIWTLANLSEDPNIYHEIIVGMGCDLIPAERLYEEILAFQKPMGLFTLHDQGDFNSVLEKGRKAYSEERLSDSI